MSAPDFPEEDPLPSALFEVLKALLPGYWVSRFANGRFEFQHRLDPTKKISIEGPLLLDWLKDGVQAALKDVESDP